MPPIDLKKSLQQVALGGLPQRAVERLQEVAGSHARLFTSDLSVKEFLTAQEAHCRPITQVMGCSVYHIGRIADYKGATGEIATITEGHREARRLAIHRLRLEARAVGADAVIGVRLRERMITTGARGKGGDDGDEIIEFHVLGTAVHAPWLRRASREPVLTDLSGQEVWALHEDGFEPTGLVFDFCRWHVFHVLGNFTDGVVNDAVDAVNQARSRAAARVSQQAQEAGAEFVIGSDLQVKAREVPCGYEHCEFNDLDVDVSWFATGVRRRPRTEVRHHDVPPLLLGMVQVGRRPRDRVLEEDDDSDRVAERAAEMEREAAEE